MEYILPKKAQNMRGIGIMIHSKAKEQKNGPKVKNMLGYMIMVRNMDLVHISSSMVPSIREIGLKIKSTAGVT